MELSTALLKSYSLINRSGLLNNPILDRLFTMAYFGYKRFYEDPFYGFVNKYPEFLRGGHVLDIGANIGYTASVFAKALTPGRKVIAFEPDRLNFERLTKYIYRSGIHGAIHPVHCAVGEKDGRIELWHNPDHNGDHRVMTKAFSQPKEGLPQTSTVRLCTIDSFIEQWYPGEPVSFVKIDVQGYELPVLSGMQKTISCNPNMLIAFEYSPNDSRQLGFDADRIFDVLSVYGFNYSVIQNDALRPLVREQLPQWTAKRGYMDILAQRPLRNH